MAEVFASREIGELGEVLLAAAVAAMERAAKFEQAILQHRRDSGMGPEVAGQADRVLWDKLDALRGITDG